MENLFWLSVKPPCTGGIGLFFFLREGDEVWTVENLGWLPSLSVVTYIAAFGVGLGPIPYILMGGFEESLC